MNAGATQDSRAVDLVPTLAAVLQGSPAPSARAQAMLDQLEAWRAAGGSRLDVDLDGKIDHPGAPCSTARGTKLADAAMGRVLGPQLEQFADIEGRFDLPPSGQFGGWHHYIDKDLRTLLGQPVQGAYQHAVLRLGRPGDLPRGPVGRDGRGGHRARGGPGQRRRRLARRRQPGADQVRPRPAAHHDAVHEPPERDPAGHLVQRPPAPPLDNPSKGSDPWSVRDGVRPRP